MSEDDQKELFSVEVFQGRVNYGSPTQQIRALGGEDILHFPDLKRFNKAQMRIMHLMRDSRWHEADEIIGVARQRGGLRRMRELRKHPDVERIDLRRVGNDFEYRMIFKL